MINEEEVKAKLDLLLSEVISLDHFKDWLVTSSWNMHLDSSPEAQDLVWSILLPIDEYEEDLGTEQQLRSRFAEILHNVSNVDLSPLVRSGWRSASQVIRFRSRLAQHELASFGGISSS
jgi:hypothetical protein